MINRIKDTIAVLLGKAKAVVIKKPDFKFRNIDFSFDENKMINSISIEFLFAEFGESRTNGGGSLFNENVRLEPTLSTLKKYFPEAKYTVYTDFDLKIDGVETIKVSSPVKFPDHERFGYRTADYFKFYSLIHSSADFKCVLDSDMKIVSSDIISLIYLTQKFGFCVPYNDRQLLRRDMESSKDTQNIKDESKGLGHSYNQSPMTLWKNDKRGVDFFSNCMEIMKNDPSRASLVMWKSAWKTGVYPYILPKQWCVCNGNEGIGDEIILHVGHKSVNDYYNDNR
ncbi:hypothetical protein [Faecalibacter bovis]|uniref:Glycosyl transferase n=1 Tax=Faecalibacter bovis TaxID=2898187 RepID=A0ABX7X9L2_9FLAO|nr:hypothetical protein [Faecalibacter bovis]QTV04562.1 hypothetical protein J9309_06965 [Faecalibacter bovis]